MPNQYTVKRTKVQRLKKFLNPNTPKKQFLMFMAVFMIIGGGYMAYRSFAAVPILKGADGEFTPLSPARILDTRDGNGGYKAPVGQTAYKVQVTGKGGVPASHVTAVVMNVTVTGGTKGSFLTIYPTGAARPASSSLNFAAGETRPNQVTAKVGTDGSVQLYNAVGTANVIFDVAGYYSDADGVRGARFKSLDPSRILDTRNGLGGFKAPVGEGGTYDVQITGQGGVPGGENVRAVVMNVTVTDGTKGSYLTVYPSNEAKPVTSNLNFGPGQTTSNQVTVKVGPNGKVKLFNATGTANVIFDVAGYYEVVPPAFNTTQEGRFMPITPTRVLDTRTTYRPVQQQPYKVDMKESLGISEDYVDAVVLNATVTDGTANSFLTMWPASAYRPATSNVNFAAGQTVANQATVKLSDTGEMNMANAVGNVSVILDAAGYFLKDNDSPTGALYAALAPRTYLKAQKVETDYVVTAIPSKYGSMAFYNYLGYVYGHVNPAGDLVTTSLFFDNGSASLQSVCFSNQTCKVLAPNAVKSPNGDNGYWIKVPIKTGVGKTYHFVQQIKKDAPNYPGQWASLSVVIDSVEYPIMAKYLGLSSDSYWIDVTLAMNTSVGAGSCKNPSSFNSVISNIKADGAYVDYYDPSTSWPFADSDYVSCPGFSKLDAVGGLSNKSMLRSYIGIPAVNRDITLPQITDINVQKRVATVTASDDHTLVQIGVDVDGNKMSPVWAPPQVCCSVRLNAKIGSLGFDLSKLSPGPHTLRAQVVDNSGNMSDKTIQITL